ncbi:MAG: hypothetical protein WBD07_13895 [Vicinamibacterales bacterium]
MKTLQELPAQVAALDTRVASLELQCFRFRVEVKGEFLATRRELGGMIDGKTDGLREELGAVAAGLREEIVRIEGRMLVRHEDVIATLKIIIDK